MIETTKIKLLCRPCRMVLLTLAPLLVSIVIFYGIVSGILTQELRSQKKNARQMQEQVIVSELNARVETAWSIIDHYYTQGLGQDACRKALGSLQFNQNNGVWIHHLDQNNLSRSVVLVHPDRALIDQPITGLKDLRPLDKIYRNGQIFPLNPEQWDIMAGSSLIRAFNEMCLDEGEGTLRYYWPRITDGQAGSVAYMKLSCVRYFSPWNWVIGAGEFEDRIDRAVCLQDAAMDYNVRQIRMAVIISFCVIGIAVSLVAYYLKNRFSLLLAENETALLSSEMKYRGLHDSILDAILQIDLDGRIIDCNRSLQAMLGYDSRELKEMSVHDLSPEKWRQIETRIFDPSAHRKGCYDIHEIEFLRKNGTVIPVEIRPFVLQDACRNPVGSWVIVRDISMRKDAEERASRSERFFQTLIANLPQKIHLKDDQSRIIYCNDKYADEMGLTIEQVIGKTDDDLYSRDIAEKHRRSDRQAVESGETVELFLRHREGREESIMRVLKTAVKNEFDRVSGILCVFEDFTDRIKNEENIRAANQKLEETNRQLREMQSQLVRSEKLASIGQLAAGVAHEINNPMAYVTNNLNSLRKYLANISDMCSAYETLIQTLNDNSSDPQEAVKTVSAQRNKLQIDYIFEDIPGLFEDSMQGIQQIIKIVKNLRDFSRVDRLEDFQPSDITEGIRSTLIVAANELKYAADVETDFEEVPEIYCNIGQLNQVFLNMLVNAAQAIREQNRREKGNIKIRVFADEAFVTCLIADDGPGIAPENLSKIFDPFFTTKPVGKGTGLGLNVSYDIIVNKHQGQLLVDSEPGQGTQFTIRLPRNLEQIINPNEVSEHGCKEDSLICG